MLNLSLIFNFLPVLIPLTLINLLISYEDYKEGIIRNEYIAILLVGGALFHILLGDLLAAAPVFLWGLFVGVLLWFLGIWPAGDAKLFTSLLLYFPPMFYDLQLILQNLVNIFLPIFLVLIVVVLVRSKKELIKNAVKFTTEPYRLFLIVVIFLGLAGFAMDFIRFLGIPGDYFLYLIVLFLFFEIFYFFLSAKTELIFTLIAIARIVLNFETMFTLSYLFDFLSLVGLFLFLRFFILYITYNYYSKKMKIEELEPGMSLAEGIVEKNGDYHKVSFLNISLIGFMMQRKEKFIHSLSFLTEEDVDKIKSLKEEGKLKMKQVLVDKKQHFGAFIFLGYLLTLFLGGSFVQVIKLII